MKHQIDWTKITCGRGDKGDTDLLYGDTCSKSDPRIITVGYIDKLCVLIGASGRAYNTKLQCNLIQLDLRKIMSWVVCPDDEKLKFIKTKDTITSANIKRLEGHIKYYGTYLNHIKFSPSDSGWIMYGEGNPKSLGVFEVCCHIRIVESYIVDAYERSCAEYIIYANSSDESRFKQFNDQWGLIITYLNRLSKLFYLGSLVVYSLDSK
jgi:cob(I)alamin adenosyltransferase